MIKNLAFKGGGVLGIAYAGAIKVLEDNRILPNVERVAGTSAGAITAALLSLRYDAATIYDIVKATDFKSFEDHKDYARIVTKYGLYKGDAFLEWMKDKIVKKGFSENATFTDFHNKGCRDLHVFATDLNTQSLKEFSFKTTPNTIVAEAVRASMSIPLFFEAWTFSNETPDNHLYVDGGMIYNFPITIFDNNGTPNPETMGLYLSNLSSKPVINSLKYDHVLDYIKIVFGTIMDAQVVNFEEDVEQKRRTAIIDNLGISATNFDLTEEQENALYQSGLKYTEAYIKANISELIG